MSIKNVEELREFLSAELGRVRGGESTPAIANSQANLAGKIIQSVKIELEYNKMVGAHPSIGFLKSKDDKLKALSSDKARDIKNG